nr:ribosomal protein L5 [Ostreobium sp. TRHA14-720]
MVQRLKKYYFDKIIPILMGIPQLNYKNKQQVPRIQKIVINRGLGDASQNEQILKSSLIILNLKIYMPVGICITLRDQYMYGFLDRLINLALPRIRDFRGLKIQSFDGKGNYTLGLEEQLMFPEINYDKIHQIRGMDISIITTAKTDQETFYLLKNFGFPFQKSETQF